MNWKRIIIITAVNAAVITAIALYTFHKTPRIAYVRTLDLLYGYNGMKEARATYKAQADLWQANIDTLRLNYQHCLSDYQSTFDKLSPKDRHEKQLLLKRLEGNLDNYSSAIKQQAQEKEQEMTNAVLVQINSYVEKFAKNQGYDYIIGSNNGNLLFGNKRFDITDKVLDAINNEYNVLPNEK